MKKILAFIIVVLLCEKTDAQVPQSFRYQAVARDNSGNVLANQSVSFRISIIGGSVSGAVAYSETHTGISTNNFGLVELEIGKGSPVTGTFSSIDWGSSSYFVKVEMDPAGGTSYQTLSTSQLLSVPYALYSLKAGNGFSGNYNDLINKPLLFDGSWLSLTGKPAFETVATSGSYTDLLNKPVLFNGTWNSLTGKPTTLGGYGITDAMGTSHVANGITSTLITNWNSAYGWGNHSNLYKPLSYFPSWSEITAIPAGFADGVDNVDDADNSTTNEIQLLSLSGNNLSLSKSGGTVSIPGDNWGTQTVASNATLEGNGLAATPLKIAQQSAGSGQVLKWNGTTWAPANDETGSGSAIPTGPAGGDLTGTYPDPIIALGTVTSAKILDGTIATDDLAANSVTSVKIPDGAVVNVDLAENAVNSIKIQDGSVETADISADAITTDKMANNAVTVAKLPSGATADKYLRGDGTWANPPTGITTETDPTWSGAANETVATGRTGNVGIGTTSPAALLHTYGTDTGQGNVVFVGQYKESSPGNPPVSGAGTRMMWYPDKAAFRAGKVDENQWDASNIGNYSAAMGYGSKASGICAFATGFYTTASNYMSIAMGYRTTASGQYSTVLGSDANATGYGGTAIGYAVLASGMYSTAMGVNTVASGDLSTAMGSSTTASSYFSTAIGRWNVGGGNKIEWIDTDPLFEIGNGGGYPIVPHNALTVLKNGYTGIGTNTPGAYLHILGNSGTMLPQLLLSESEADYARLSFKNTAATTKNWSIAGRPDPTDANSLLNFWYWNGTAGSDMMSIKGNGNIGIGTTNPSYKLDIAGPINLNKGLTMGALYCNGSQALWFDGTHYSWGYGGGPGTTFNYFANPITIGNAANPSYMLYVQGSAYTTGSWGGSDARFKKNITPIGSVLEKVMSIRGTSFEFRKEEFMNYQFDEGTQFGFIAQELEEVFPEVVKTEPDGYKSVNYNGMIPVLLQAIKEQQNGIEKLKTENERLKADNEKISSENAALAGRLEKIEVLIGITTSKKYGNQVDTQIDLRIK